MRRLNRRVTGRRGLAGGRAGGRRRPGGRVVGEGYLGPGAGERWGKGGGKGAGGGRTVAEELVRLAVHGTLHVLGFDHPEGPGRTRSAMWHRQERYVRRLLGTRGERTR